MANVGKISIIKKEYEAGGMTFMNSLRQNGYQRPPGTKKTIFPYKENNGDYRTGLNELAAHVLSIPDKTLREDEQRRIKALRESLEFALQISLGPKSKYYNFASDSPIKVDPFKLGEDDALFDLNDPISAVTFAWVSVHPAVAPSLEAYNRGDVLADTQYFVNDDQAENKAVYDKKRILNDAIVKLNSLSSDRKKKIARLMELPYSDNTSDEVVYNALDSLIRTREMPSGPNKGRLPVDIFNSFVAMSSDTLDVQDLVDQAIKTNIYRYVKGKLKEGEHVAWQSKEELLDHMMDVKNQADRLELEKRIQINKLKEV